MFIKSIALSLLLFKLLINNSVSSAHLLFTIVTGLVLPKSSLSKFVNESFGIEFCVNDILLNYSEAEKLC